MSDNKKKVTQLDIEEEFIQWLSKGFKYDTAFAQEGAARIYYAFVKRGERKGFYTIPGFTKASLSRLRSKLIADGFFYEMSARAVSATKTYTPYLIPLHPYPLIKWIAKHETYTEMTTLRKKFGNIIDNLTSTWQENFGILFQKKECFFPVVGRVGWKTHIAYGNLFGWLFASKAQLRRVLAFTPHLMILKDYAFREIVREFVKQDIEFEFIAFEDAQTSLSEERDALFSSDSLKIWTLNPADENINLNPHTERDMVMIDKDNVPFFGFEAKKIEETKSYVGAVHARCEERHVYNIRNALENLKRISKLSP